MKWCAFRFRPSSHSEDCTLMATYTSDRAAKKVEAALKRMLEDMAKNSVDYDADWSPEDANIWVSGKEVCFEVYTGGYLDFVEALLRKVSKPKEVERYQNYQELDISVTVDGGLTPEAALLVLNRDEAEAVKWLVKRCGRPKIVNIENGKRQFKWFYRGDEIYCDGVLFIGFEFPVDECENWSVE